MSQINSQINSLNYTPPSLATSGAATASGAGESNVGGSRLAREGGDRVEVSEQARLLGQLSELPEVREDLVARVKAEIAAGTYITDEKISGAVDSLLEDL